MNIKLRNVYFSLLRYTSTRTVYCLGDSHIRVFNHPLFKIYFPLTYFDITAVDGATASGLQNPHSKTQARTIFYSVLEKLDKPGKVIFNLGEVDCGYVIWWRAARYGVPVADMSKEAVRNYVELITAFAEQHEVIVISAPLPTIGDDAPIGEVAIQRQSIKVPQAERTVLTLAFNKSVSEEVASIPHVRYVNLDKYSLNPDSGLVVDGLKNRNRTNHHYDKKSYARLLIAHLRNIL